MEWSGVEWSTATSALHAHVGRRGPSVDNEIVVDPQAGAFVCDCEERVHEGPRRADLAGPANGDIVSCGGRDGAVVPVEVDGGVHS